MIEIKSKEDIFKLIEEADKLKPLTIINKSSDGDEVEKKYRSIYLIGYKNINLSLLDSEIAWNFLNKTQNIIDLQDFLLTYDHQKLINKAKKTVKDKDCKKIETFFEKFYKERERKYREIFKGNLEDNDLIFLETEEYALDYKLPPKLEISIKAQDYWRFPKLFEKLNNNLKSHLMNFLDLQTVGKFSMCNKAIHQFVTTKYNFEKLAKFYCLMIFKNTNLYINVEKELKLYKNYFEMYKKR